VFSLDFLWLGKCGVLFLFDLYIYFGFPLARLKWSPLLKSVRLPLQDPDNPFVDIGDAEPPSIYVVGGGEDSQIR
jgi:hypothetical protein